MKPSPGPCERKPKQDVLLPLLAPRRAQGQGEVAVSGAAPERVAAADRASAPRRAGRAADLAVRACRRLEIVLGRSRSKQSCNRSTSSIDMNTTSPTWWRCGIQYMYPYPLPNHASSVLRFNTSPHEPLRSTLHFNRLMIQLNKKTNRDRSPTSSEQRFNRSMDQLNQNDG